MYGDTWQVRWKEFLSDSYVYGSKIEFNEDGSVSYKNRLMPPGTVIHTWYSMTNFQGNRIEPSLPLIDGERAYSIAVNIDYHNSESEALMLRIIFLTGMMYRRRVLLSAIKGGFQAVHQDLQLQDRADKWWKC